MNLKDLEIGKTATIKKVNGSGSLRQHFLDMGLIQGTEVTVVKYAPMGDPIEVRIHGYELTLRLEDASLIEISEPHIPSVNKVAKDLALKKHPGYGEKKKKLSKIVDSKETLTFALVGNQNCGKTTLFNQLTGSNQHVGNFPGVTVDRKDGVIIEHPNTLIADLPGIYSMSPYSSEEIVTREFLLQEKPRAIINIVDATNIERNLYLTMQLMEMNVPMVVALNMMDELSKNGGSIRVNEMEEALGVPVIPISAVKGEGIDELVNHALHVAIYDEKPKDIDFCDKEDGALHRGIHAIMHLIEDHSNNYGVPIRFAASKIMEGDTQIGDLLHLDKAEKDIISKIIKQTEEELHLDHASAIASMRYKYIEKVSSNNVVKPKESKEHLRSKQIDKILTGKYTGIPSFILIMGLVFYLTFEVFGKFLQTLLEMGIEVFTVNFEAALIRGNVNSALVSLIVDGVLNGVGGVLSFLPIIVVLFFFLSMLEDSGYMARVAFIMDKLLRKLGLSGRSIVPMLIGFGCTVPGVMASRTLPSQRDRKMTILLTPFMSCSAKLPIYAFFASVFFPGHEPLVMILLYVLGIVIGIIMALVFNNSLFKGEPVPFVMELPNYRIPTARNVVQLLWEKAEDFLYRAFTVIFIGTIVIWFLQTFDFSMNMVSDSQNSMLAYIAGMIAPIFSPIGFGDWRIATSLISGFMAKESVVSTLSVLFGSTTALLETISIPAAASLLVFSLLYTPCIAAVASIKRELGTKWAIIVVVGQCVLAWLVAFVIYHIALIL